MATDRICVVLIHRQNLENTLACLDSLANGSYAKFTCLVINHKAADTSAIRSKHPNTLIDDASNNLGDEASFNIGIEWALTKNFTWILLLSSDVQADPHLLKEFMKQAMSSPEAKIFGAKILHHDEPTHVEELGRMWIANRAIYTSIAGGETDGESYENSHIVESVSLNALLMHRIVPDTIGLLEPSFRGSWGDLDFCFRARRKKFIVQTAPFAKVWHKTTRDNECLTHYFWWRGRLLWLSRNVPSSERRDIIRRIIGPEIRKLILLIFAKTVSRLFFRSITTQEQLLRAGLKGVLHSYGAKGSIRVDR